MRLPVPKLSRASVFGLIVAVLIFIEIIVMSPQVLEKENSDFADPGIPLNELNAGKGKNGVEQKMQGVHLVENAQNEKGWELYANEATGRADGQWTLRAVKVQFFSKNQPSYVVTGDVGEIESETKDMIIRGNANTQSSNGYRFKTDTVRYLAKQKLMTSSDPVIMEGPPDNSGSGFKLTGEKLLVDLQRNKMSILEKIAAYKVINNKEFKINSSRADFSNNNQEASFIGNVKMLLGGINVTAPLAVFQYSSAKKLLEKINLSDKVEFFDGDKKGYCGELEFDMLENKMTMRGQPKVVQGDDEIKGHEIVFIDGGKKVKINRDKK